MSTDGDGAQVPHREHSNLFELSKRFASSSCVLVDAGSDREQEYSAQTNASNSVRHSVTCLALREAVDAAAALTALSSGFENATKLASTASCAGVCCWYTCGRDSGRCDGVWRSDIHCASAERGYMTRNNKIPVCIVYALCGAIESAMAAVSAMLCGGGDD